MTTAFLLGVALLMLALCIGVHELGHLLVAKRAGMHVYTFRLFFGRPVLRFRRGATEYRLGWIPLGGAVDIAGMTPSDSDPGIPEHRTYRAAPTRWKMMVIAAGPAVNLLLALVCMSAAFMLGTAHREPTTALTAVVSPGIAADAGLRVNDRITSVLGRPVHRPEELLSQLETAKARGEVAITYVRDGREHVAVLHVPEDRALEDETALRGVFGSRLVASHPSIVEAVTESASLMARISALAGADLVRPLSGDSPQSLGSVVGFVASYAGADTHPDPSATPLVTTTSVWSRALMLCGILSFGLGLFNLLPVLPLDGGRLVFALIEGLRRRPLAPTVHRIGLLVGGACVLAVLVVGVRNDTMSLSGSSTPMNVESTREFAVCAQAILEDRRADPRQDIRCSVQFPDGVRTFLLRNGAVSVEGSAG